MKIGMIGVGVVGGATAQVLGKAHEIFLYDKYRQEYNSQEHIENLVKNSEIVFISVPTPMKPSGEIDCSSIHNSLNQILETCRKVGRDPKHLLIVIRSTAVSGTTDKLEEIYPFHISFNPEFLTEKNALNDMLSTDRVVIGAGRVEDHEKVVSVYKPLFPDAKYILINRKTAEMIKYASNVFLTAQVAIANEIYQICKAVGVDYDIIKNAVLYDNRIGKHLHVPGPDGDLGFGGRCFPKDLNALIYLARENMYRPHLLEEVWRLNERVRKNKDWLDINRATSENSHN